MSKHQAQVNQPTVLAGVIRVVYFLVLVGSFYTVYKLALQRVFAGNGIVVTLLALWVVSSYILLPRIHRWLSKVYVPDYYIGRVRTFDGLLGDPVNLAVLGTKKELIRAMEAAGWTRAEELSWQSTIKMIHSSIFKKSYPTAPVSSLFLFGNKQDLAFQIEVNNNPHKRHHVRFWKTPKGWWLPGGYKADWLGAATYDRRVGLSTLTLQVTHKIAENVDEERDFVIKTLQSAKQTKNVVVVSNFTSGYHSKNGGGDKISTDGSLPFIHM